MPVRPRRAVEPFSKKSNLQRHLKEIHGNREPDFTTEAEQTEAEAAVPTAKRRRSRSRTPGLSHLCPYPRCPRAVEGFTKRSRLRRHLQEVHGERGFQFPEDEEDSADEMEGGIHVDGFLRPIKIRKGWRGDDLRQRPPRARKKTRAESEELYSLL
ncbi:hypothetical protein VTH82DRAFT_2222 [Thermothelomyces myriococcoides]